MIDNFFRLMILIVLIILVFSICKFLKSDRKITVIQSTGLVHACNINNGKFEHFIDENQDIYICRIAK